MHNILCLITATIINVILLELLLSYYHIMNMQCIIIIIIIRYGFFSVVRYTNNGHVNTTFDDAIHFVVFSYSDVIIGGD